MDKKFQSDTKELDEKFAAIPENSKKRYDRHKFIRRVIIGYYSSAATTIYFSLMLMFFLDLLFSNIGIESSSKIFRDIRDVAIIVLPICATICFLRYTKTKRYSNLFIKDQLARRAGGQRLCGKVSRARSAPGAGRCRSGLRPGGSRAA